MPSVYLRDAHLPFVERGFCLVTWDQLGCGESDRPNDPTLWTVERYVDEMEAVRSSLALDQIIIIGHSWGAYLAMEYCQRFPSNVRKFVSANIAFSFPKLQVGFRRIKLGLKDTTYSMMLRREEQGSTDHSEYQAAIEMLLHRHMCRVDTWPSQLTEALSDENLGVGPLSTLFGPLLFNLTGTLKNRNIEGDLERINIPTLLIGGEHDFILPDLIVDSHRLIADSECVILRNCSHMPFWEDPSSYLSAITRFIEGD